MLDLYRWLAYLSCASARRASPLILLTHLFSKVCRFLNRLFTPSSHLDLSTLPRRRADLACLRWQAFLCLGEEACWANRWDEEQPISFPCPARLGEWLAGFLISKHVLYVGLCLCSWALVGFILLYRHIFAPLVPWAGVRFTCPSLWLSLESFVGFLAPLGLAA